ncbi:MAG: FAD-dependent oxidoreductase [Clostridia bacterium]|nr:FAD-dependent oxidoreductase [Clostridia bacterium]
MSNISRRDFLRGAAASALSVAAMTSGLGVQAMADGTAEVEKDVYAPFDKIPQAYLNVQDESYRTANKELKAIFSPLTMGSITISNRFVKSAAGSACYLNGLTDELFQYYVNFAKGGVEMIYVEGVALLEAPADGSGLPEETIAWGKALADECAKYGASLGYQWAAFGMGENEMTVEQIQASEDAGVEIAKGIQSMGWKAIEINAAGFNRGEQFLSRFHNTRTDEYGAGSLENRARFVTEFIQKTKAACGKDFNVQVLIDCIEENDNIANNPTLMTLDDMVTVPHALTTTEEEGIGFAKLFEAAGADSMHLRLGPLGHHVAQFGADLYFILNGLEGATGFGTQYDFKKHWQGKLIGDTNGCGMTIELCARYKKAVNIPCGIVTYMDPAHAPDFFEQAIEDGKVDFFLMNRPLTVDTEYVNKLKEGRADEIAPCTRCLHCHIAGNEANRMFGYCRVNALTQRVMTENGPATYELPAAETKKKVMVVGAGPAGMECARIAAQRGHDVTLYEKNGYLGGLLTFASTVKGPHENLEDLKKYLIRQLELANVKVVTGTEVTKELIESEAPDAVVLACGGLRDKLEIPGAEVIEMNDFMFKSMGENVVVYGSGAQAWDAALWLTVHKKNVTIVSPDAATDFDKQQSQHAKRMMTTALYSLGVRAWAESSITKVENGVATVVYGAGGGVEMEVPCDAVINAADMLPNKGLLEGLSVAETYAIGDCNSPYNIALAIRGGNDVGRAL